MANQPKETKFPCCSILVITALLAIPVCICSFWIWFPVAGALVVDLFQQDAIDPQLFNTNREPLPDDAVEAQIFPQQIGEYLLQPSIDRAERTDSQRSYFHEYKLPFGGTIHFRVSLLKDDYSQEKLLSSGTNCGDGSGPAKVFSDERLPFGYAICNSFFARTHHTLNWINGNWILSASSASILNSDGNMLLDFVNQYDY